MCQYSQKSPDMILHTNCNESKGQDLADYIS